jgi:predicted RNA-binding protein with TRAM domain
MTEPLVKKGQELELTIESLAYGGKGIARVDDFVIFVKNAIPGQKVRALLYRKRKGFGEARPLEILSGSKYVVDPPCEHFPVCGGCKVQQLDYAEQLAQKKQQVENIFQRQAGLDDFTLDEVIPAEDIFNYRGLPVAGIYFLPVVFSEQVVQHNPVVELYIHRKQENVHKEGLPHILILKEFPRVLPPQSPFFYDIKERELFDREWRFLQK